MSNSIQNDNQIEKHYNKTGILRKGQEQIFVIIKFTGTDQDISLQKE